MDDIEIEIISKYCIIPSLGLSGLLREVCEGYQLSALDRFDVHEVAPDDDAFGAAGSCQDFAARHLEEDSQFVALLLARSHTFHPKVQLQVDTSGAQDNNC